MMEPWYWSRYLPTLLMTYSLLVEETFVLLSQKFSDADNSRYYIDITAQAITRLIINWWNHKELRNELPPVRSTGFMVDICVCQVPGGGPGG